MSINYQGLAFPKPSDIARQPVRIYPQGREVIDTNTRLGYEEYRRRVHAMVERQSGICCLHGWAPNCPGLLDTSEATFEHEYGRGFGGGKREDRIILPCGTWINGAAHGECNGWKSSRYIAYNRTFQNRRITE